MRPRLLLALLVLAGCSVDCNPDRSPTFPSAATATDSPICLPTGYTVVGVDMGGFLLAEEQPARPRAYTTRWHRVVECGADQRACPCSPPLAEVAP